LKTREKQKEDLKKEYEANIQAKLDAEAAEKERQEQLKAENKAFWQKLETSEDLNDNLTDLCNYIHKNIGATGVYMSKLEPKMKEIADDADDQAHIDAEAPHVLKFKHANEDHQELMVGAVLEPNQGICHQLFTGGDGEGEEAPAEEEEGEEVKEKSEDILKTYPHKFISHVVRQKDIHFWRVPRLGSFMAIPLIYKSCMSEEALDEAITDWIDVQKRIAEQDAKKLEWEEEQAANKADNPDGAPAEPEEPWEDI
jgi:hypothetical protein